MAEWEVWLYYMGKDNVVCEQMVAEVHVGRSPGGSDRKVM